MIMTIAHPSNVIWLILSLLLLPICFYWKKFAPWVPMNKKDLETVKGLADLQPGQRFVDLGCGDGRVPAFIADETKAEALGVEIVLPLFLVCKLRQWRRQNPRLSYQFWDLFHLDLSNFDVVYVFGMPNSLKARFQEKCQKELKTGAKIISYCFSIQGWKPEIVSRGEKGLPIYLYKKA